jgi:hypothetical protein
VHLRLNTAQLQPADLDQAGDIIAAHPGRCPLVICLHRPDGSSVYIEAHDRFGVTPSLELEMAINQKFGDKAYYAKVDTSLPEKTRRAWEKKASANTSGGEE